MRVFRSPRRPDKWNIWQCAANSKVQRNKPTTHCRFHFITHSTLRHGRHTGASQNPRCRRSLNNKKCCLFATFEIPDGWMEWTMGLLLVESESDNDKLQTTVLKLFYRQSWWWSNLISCIQTSSINSLDQMESFLQRIRAHQSTTHTAGSWRSFFIFFVAVAVAFVSGSL